jgi:hypothetical protein
MIDCRELTFLRQEKKPMTVLDIPYQPFARRDAKPLLEIVRNFTPNWFTVTMGTGAVALTLNQFPLAVPGLRAAAVGLWFANIALFALFSLFYGARWILFPREAALIFRHPVMSMFFGAIPMGSRPSSMAFSPLALISSEEPPPSASRALFGRRTLRCRSSAGLPSPISCSPARNTRWRS